MSRIVFKQWIYKPNKRGTPKAISNMMEYIATREGVELPSFNLSDELNSLENQQAFEKEMYLQYIATRKGVDTASSIHGLFGKMLGMKEMDCIEDLELARGYVENLAHDKKTIYNAVISFSAEDAAKKELTDRKAWERLISNNINEIARQMDLSPRTLEYAAAVHIEKNHPHVHLMYWDTAQTIGKNFISPEKSNDIRKSIIKREFDEEIIELRVQKDLLHDALMGKLYKNDNSLLKSAKNAFAGMELSEVYDLSKKAAPIYEILNRRLADKNIAITVNSLLELDKQIKQEYPKGAFKYKLMPKPIKESLDKISASIIKNNLDIAKSCNEYIDTVKQQASLFGGSHNVNSYVFKAKQSLMNEIGNKVLFTIKEMRNISFAAKQEHRTEERQKYIDSYNRSAVMNLFQAALDVITMSNHQAGAATNKKITKDMSKAQKSDIIKKSKENTLEWGD